MVKKLSATLTFLISLLFPLWLLRKQCAKKVVSDSPAGLKIMAGQQRMSSLIADLTGPTPVLPVILTSHF